MHTWFDAQFDQKILDGIYSCMYVVRFQYVWLIVVTLFSSSWLEAGSSIAMRDFQFEISIHDFIHSQVYWDMNKILSTNCSLFAKWMQNLVLS